MRPNFILSSCGTSLLTNNVGNEERKLFIKYANAAEKDIPATDIAIIKPLVQTIRNILMQSGPHQVANFSAELNAIVKFYHYKLDHNYDVHYLLTTDTWLGHLTGQMLQAWLKQYFSSVNIYAQKDLQTADLNRFQLALSDLVVWCSNNISADYHVVFNLTGGFKSVQGFLQTLAMFYADEAIYVFESGDELLRLPKLPVRIDPDNTLRDHFPLMRQLNLGLSVTLPENLPKTLIMQIDDQTTLSQYGQIIFQQLKNKFYTEQIYEPPTEKIRFGPKFIQSVQNLSPDRKKIVNERIDDLTTFFMSNKIKNINRLDFKELRGNPRPPSTHEMDAWADQDAKRIYGHYEEENFVLDKLDRALH